MKEPILCLLLLFVSIPFTQAQFFKSIGNQINNTLSGNNKTDSSSQPKHHRKGNMLDNFKKGIAQSHNSNDSTLKLSKEDEGQPTHADLSKFNTQHFYKLQEGEKFSFYEACLLMQADKLNPQILIVKDGKPWLIGNEGQHIAVNPQKMNACPLNGKRGDVVPFDRLDGDQSKLYGDDPAIFSIKSPKGGTALNEMGFDTTALNNMQRSIDAGDSAAAFRQAISMKKPDLKNVLDFKPRTTIVFRGKVYGPYLDVRSYAFSKGAGKFLAIVDLRKPNADITTVKGDISRMVEYWLVGSDGARIKLPDDASKIIADEEFSFVRIYSVKSIPDKTREATASLFDPKTGKSIQIITDEGSNSSRTVEQSIEMKGGNVITKHRDGQQIKLYVNDKWMTTLEGESDIPLSNVFVSKDAGRWAVWGSKALYFSNGEKVDGVISVRVGDRNSGYSLSWIVLGNDNKTLELCDYEL